MFQRVLCSIVVLCFIGLTDSQQIIYLQSDESPFTNCSTVPHVQLQCYNLTALASGHVLNGNFTDLVIALLPGKHTYSGIREKIVSITNISTLEFVALNPSGDATGSTVISCKDSKGIGFAFRNISNVTVRGITFEECGTPEHFALSISYSGSIIVQDVELKYCIGIALKVEYLEGSLVLKNSIFTNNQANVYVYATSYSTEEHNDSSHPDTMTITIDSSNFTSGSNFNTGKHMGTNYQLPNVTNPGVTVVLNRTKGFAVLTLSNVTMYVQPQDLYSTGYCDIYHNMHTSSIHIDGLQCHTEMVQEVHDLLYGYRIIPGMSINPRNYSTDAITDGAKPCGNITIKNSHFDNSRLQIGPVERTNENFHLTLKNVTIDNTVDPLSIINMGNVTLAGNVTVSNSDGLMCIAKCKNVMIHDGLVHQNNRGQLLFFYIGTVILYEGSLISVNHSQQGQDYPEDWPVYVIGSKLLVLEGSALAVMNNIGRRCGGLALENTPVLFEGNSRWLFLNNSGRWGGAMVLKKKSKFSICPACGIDAKLMFVNNRASRFGGGMFVADSDYIIKGVYLGDDRYEPFTVGSNITFYFENNTAGAAGSAIFGGWIDNLQSKFEFANTSLNDLSLVSSDPVRLCLCSDSRRPSCSKTVDSFELIPGETMMIGIVAVGQRNGVIPSNVLADYLGTTNAKLKRLQYTQSVGRKCTDLQYTVRSTEEIETLKLTVASTTNFVALQHDRNIDTDISISITLKDCPSGFLLDSVRMACICEQNLIVHDIECNLTTFKILRPSSKWINATFNHLNSKQSSGVIIHNHCPFDYCKQTQGDSELNLNYPDEQCAFNRSGILCGACQSHLSRVFGSSKCKTCTKYWIALVVPLIALAGVALVVVLIVLNLTVSVGTINGLVFYANVVRANNSVFFPNEISNSFFGVFIAWLNLDLGVETCFYTNVDAIAITWFQFLFPLYIWLIVVTIIVASHYSTKVSKLCGGNAVQVLATLFLLSYAKLLRIIITVFSSTSLVYPNGHQHRVWLYDGNVDYLKGNHVYLFIVALVLLIAVSIPYTATLLLVQPLQRFSNYRMLFWVAKLHPLFDAYTGPCKVNHRYWTGLLLLARACLFLVISLNVSNDPTVNLLAVSLMVLVLCGYNAVIGGVYKNWLLNLVEVSFILNLGVLSAVAHFLIASEASVIPVTYTSSGIALIVFVCIILFHIKSRALSSRTKLGQALRMKLNHFTAKIYEKNTQSVSDITENTTTTYSTVDLRELLLST